MQRTIGLVSLLLCAICVAEEAVLDLRPERPTPTPFLDSLKSQPTLGFTAQSVTLSTSELHALQGAKMNQAISLPSLDLGLTKGAALTFRRIDIYAKGARSIEKGVHGERVQPRSGRLFFLGKSRSGSAGLALDPKTNQISGMLVEGVDSYTVSSVVAKNGDTELHLVNLAQSDRNASFQCELGEDHKALNAKATLEHLYPSRSAIPKGGPLVYQTDIAVDTDNEFMSNKFSNNTTNAQNWIEDLFLNMNVIYERDLQMRLLLGNTTLRTAADPYSDSNDLNEFGQYWIDNNQGIARDFVMLLSGQGVGSNSFSGVAWVNAYCVSTQVFVQPYGSYSFNRIGTNLSAAFSSGGIGHEIGHNLGSSHTHCERLANGGADFVDTCYSCEDNDGVTCNNANCYVGATACVAGGAGTLMSYCHAGPNGFDGAGPAVGPPATPSCDNSDVFDPLIIAKLNGLLASNNPSCIDNFDGDAVFADGFESP